MDVIINKITPVSVELFSDDSVWSTGTEHILVNFTLKNETLSLNGEIKLTGNVNDINLSLPHLRETILKFVKQSI